MHLQISQITASTPTVHQKMVEQQRTAAIVITGKRKNQL